MRDNIINAWFGVPEAYKTDIIEVLQTEVVDNHTSTCRTCRRGDLCEEIAPVAWFISMLRESIGVDDGV